LKLGNLKLPASPPVERVEAEDYTDSSGESALRVQVIIKESTDIDQVSGADVGELKSAIRASLRRHGVTFFPYIFLAKPSELAEVDAED